MEMKSNQPVHVAASVVVRGHLSQPILSIKTTRPDATIPLYIPPHRPSPYLVWT